MPYGWNHDFAAGDRVTERAWFRKGYTALMERQRIANAAAFADEDLSGDPVSDAHAYPTSAGGWGGVGVLQTYWATTYVDSVASLPTADGYPAHWAWPGIWRDPQYDLATGPTTPAGGADFDFWWTFEKVNARTGWPATGPRRFTPRRVAPSFREVGTDYDDGMGGTIPGDGKWHAAADEATNAAAVGQRAYGPNGWDVWECVEAPDVWERLTDQQARPDRLDSDAGELPNVDNGFGGLELNVRYRAGDYYGGWLLSDVRRAFNQLTRLAFVPGYFGADGGVNQSSATGSGAFAALGLDEPGAHAFTPDYGGWAKGGEGHKQTNFGGTLADAKADAEAQFAAATPGSFWPPHALAAVRLREDDHFPGESYVDAGLSAGRGQVYVVNQPVAYGYRTRFYAFVKNDGLAPISTLGALDPDTEVFELDAGGTGLSFTAWTNQATVTGAADPAGALDVFSGADIGDEFTPAPWPAGADPDPFAYGGVTRGWYVDWPNGYAAVVDYDVAGGFTMTAATA